MSTPWPAGRTNSLLLELDKLEQLESSCLRSALLASVLGAAEEDIKLFLLWSSLELRLELV